MNNLKSILNLQERWQQSYRNLLYLLLAFPTGLVYFVFLVVGLSLGAGLLIIWVGVPILLIVFETSRGMLEYERQSTNRLLGTEIEPLQYVEIKGMNLLQKLKRRFQDPILWKGIGYLFAKFPLGICSFVLCITLIALTFGLITAPLTFSFVPITIGLYRLNTLREAITAALCGVGVGFLSILIFNSFASVLGRYTVRLLGSSTDQISGEQTEV